MPSASMARETDALRGYFEAIGRERTLTSAEEAALAARIRKGDAKALARLVLANLRFVVNVARAYENHGVPLADLIGEGNVGMLRAARRFDERKNFKFITYAVWWVRQSILKALAGSSRVVKMPLHRAALARRIGRVQSRLEQRLERTPTAEETAREAGLSTREVENTLRASAPVVSLDKPLQEEDGDSLGDITADPDQEMPDQGCTDASSRRFIDRMLDELDPRERQILLLYYGMGDEEPYSLAEIGHRYRMTRERTRQLKQRAINRIRRSLPSHKRATLGV